MTRWAILLMLVLTATADAIAPARGVGYAESRCNTDPDIFFCEDFEGGDIESFAGGPACDSQFGNPAIETKDVCWAQGGSHQLSTIPLTGFIQSANRVWRIAKGGAGFTDIVTGNQTGTGSGTLAGWLFSNIMGTGTREWYARAQVYWDPSFVFPADYDYKVFFALPRDFIDPPSAVYETGITLHQDMWCSLTNLHYPDVPMLRYSSNFALYPGEQYGLPGAVACPPLMPGADPDGTRAPRLERGRWYTLEYHYRLSSTQSSNDGLLELWVDGIKAYTVANINTCNNGCPDMGYIMIMGYMNPADMPWSGFTETDNVIISRAYIGPPTGSVDLTPPSVPTGLRVVAP